MEQLIEEMKNNQGTFINFFCITEHWLRQYEIEGTILKNFHVVANSCRDNFSHGGTLVFSSNANQFKITDRPDFQEGNIEKVFECSAIQVKINKKNKFILLCLYRAPSGDFNCFLDKLEQCLNLICRTENSNFVVCGDFNVDFIIPSNQRQQLLTLFEGYGGRSIVSQPTRTTNQSCTLIDNVFTNMQNFSSFVKLCTFSDHDVVFFEFDIKETFEKKTA